MYLFQESMQTYQDMGDNYEPSADELIDVLKNLENLAAINPALYRAIVDQIKSKITYRNFFWYYIEIRAYYECRIYSFKLTRD